MTGPLVDNTIEHGLCIQEKNQNDSGFVRFEMAAASRATGSRGFYPALTDSQARYRDIRFVWQVHKRVHSYRSKCSGPPGLVEPHGHCTSYNTACHAYTRGEHAHAYCHDPSHTGIRR